MDKELTLALIRVALGHGSPEDKAALWDFLAKMQHEQAQDQDQVKEGGG